MKIIPFLIFDQAKPIISMSNIILFDSAESNHLLPLTFTRPVCELRIGILTIRQKWEYLLKVSTATLTKDFLQAKFPLHIKEDNILINGHILPNEDLVSAVQLLQPGEILGNENQIIAARMNATQTAAFHPSNVHKVNQKYYKSYTTIKYPWDIFSNNAVAIESDFKWLTKNKTSQSLSQTNRAIRPDRIFIEEGAQVEMACLNATDGPIYIGKNALIMEGSLIRGPFAMCENAVLKMGAKIYKGTTLGPHCKVGGEVSNSVLQGYSSKAHDGYLGNSVLGEWCNLGADTNNSNLKNNYAEVKVWNYPKEGFKKTGLQFCGLIMGDHSKCGINTMFNTGTVVGVFANIFGSGFPRNFVPSFSWGGHSGFTTYQTRKAFEVAERVMMRRSKSFDENERAILETIFEYTAQYRHWERTPTT